MGRENIKFNTPYKYPKVCEIFEQKKNGGKAKALQIKDWERYFTIEKGEKATFIFKDVLEEPIVKVDGRGKSEGSRNNYDGIYTKYSAIILLDYLNTYKQSKAKAMFYI